MRKMAVAAEKYLDDSGDVRGFDKKSQPDDADSAEVAAALKDLKAEIAKLEGGG